MHVNASDQLGFVGHRKVAQTRKPKTPSRGLRDLTERRRGSRGYQIDDKGFGQVPSYYQFQDEGMRLEGERYSEALGEGFKGPGTYTVQLYDNSLENVYIDSPETMDGLLGGDLGVEVYREIPYDVDGLGFSLKKAFKKVVAPVRKVVKVVTKPAAKLVQKVTELPGLKQIKAVVRKVVAPAAGIMTAGLIKSKALGIRSAAGTKAFETTGKIVRGAALAPILAPASLFLQPEQLGIKSKQFQSIYTKAQQIGRIVTSAGTVVAAALLKKVMTSKGVPEEQQQEILSGQQPIPPDIEAALPPSSEIVVMPPGGMPGMMPGGPSAGGGGGGEGTEAEKTPEEKAAEEQAAAQAGMFGNVNPLMIAAIAIGGLYAYSQYTKKGKRKR